MEFNKPLSAYKEELEKLLLELSIQGLQCPADHRHRVSLCQHPFWRKMEHYCANCTLCPCKTNLLVYKPLNAYQPLDLTILCILEKQSTGKSCKDVK